MNFEGEFLDSLLDLDVPLRRRLVAGAAGVAASPAVLLMVLSLQSTEGGRRPGPSKGNLISRRLLDFYRGGRLIASPCGADIIGLP